MERSYPPVAERIAQARRDAGLDTPFVAAAIGISAAAYDDLEAYDHEAFMCISLGQVCRLGQLLNVSPRQLIAAQGTQLTSLEVSFVELVNAIRGYLENNFLSVQEFEDQVGWIVSGALQDPQAGCNDWNLDALQDICALIGVNWLWVLPNPPPNPNTVHLTF